MNLQETSAVLAKCAAYDRRTVGASDVLAWHEVLECLDLADALEAVKRWYTTNREWIMPSDVLSLGRDVIQERIREANARLAVVVAPATDLRPLTDRSAEILAFVRKVRDTLPAGRPELIRRPRNTKRGRKAV